MAEAADRAVDWAVRSAVRAVMALPYERRVPAFAAFVRRVAGPLAGFRRREMDNLLLIHPDWTAARRRALAEAALDSIGRYAIETYSHADVFARVAGQPILGGGLPHLQRAAAEGRPVLLVSGHFGNVDVVRYALVQRGHAVGAFYRASNNRFINRHYYAATTAVSGPFFAKGRRGLLALARHLRGGGMTSLLFDVRDPTGIPLPFLGRPAMTPTTPALLALRTGALVLPHFGVRRADGLTHDLHLEEPVAHGTPRDMMAEMTARLEARMATDPAQWMWIHRRWKA